MAFKFNELSDLIFSIAYKITDIEYKNIMDKMMEIRNDYLDKKKPEDESNRCRCDPFLLFFILILNYIFIYIFFKLNGYLCFVILLLKLRYFLNIISFNRLYFGLSFLENGYKKSLRVF